MTHFVIDGTRETMITKASDLWFEQRMIKEQTMRIQLLTCADQTTSNSTEESVEPEKPAPEPIVHAINTGVKAIERPKALRPRKPRLSCTRRVCNDPFCDRWHESDDEN